MNQTGVSYADNCIGYSALHNLQMWDFWNIVMNVIFHTVRGIFYLLSIMLSRVMYGI